MKKNNKKGFTLVELLVVIAILAILATVSIVGYTSFTKKAKISNDISLTTQLNTILEANEATDGANKYPHEAFEELVDGGFDVSKFTPTTNKYNYVYDLSQNRIFLLDESYNVVAPSDLSLGKDSVSIYGVASSQSDVTEFNNHNYSVYLKSSYNSSTVNTTCGVDVGENEDVDINLTSNDASTYLFRTNGGTLTVDAKNATVKHYGDALKVNVVAVASNSYHESGKVDVVEFAKGRFVAETGSEVSFLNVTATNANDVASIEIKSGSEVVAVTASSSDLAKSLESKISSETGSTKVYDKKDVENKAVYTDNNGTIEMYDTVNEAITKIKKGTIKLLKDITEDIVVPTDADITINLNDKNITNSSSDTIKVLLNGKLTVEGDGVVDNVTHGMACILNNGIITLNGGKYTRSKEASSSKNESNGNSYYNILNHGEMTINKDVEVYSTGAFSSLIVTGYYDYTKTESGEKTAYISGTNMAEPKLTINGGSFSGGINTVKIDDGATAIINNGTFGNTTQAVIFNANKAYINGGEFEMPTNANGFYSVESRNFNSEYNCVYTEIRGGVFKGVVKNDSNDANQLVIYGGTFNSGIEGVHTDKR